MVIRIVSVIVFLSYPLGAENNLEEHEETV